jgi:Zn-finger nucleic acid-binding protein
MNCPKCSSAMAPIRHGEVEIDRCTSCQGLWFDAFEHEELKELRGAEQIDAVVPTATAVAAPPREVECPRCSVAMIHMVVAGQPHIAYESCGVCHGVYFDAGEFRDFREETLGERLRHYFGVARKG